MWKSRGGSKSLDELKATVYRPILSIVLKSFENRFHSSIIPNGNRIV